MPETNTTNSLLYGMGQAQAAEGLGPFFELAPYPIWVFDLETLAMVAVNQAAIDHYDYSREEMLAMKVTDLMAPFEVTRLLATLDASGTMSHYPTWVPCGYTARRIKPSSIPIPFHRRLF